MLTVTSVALTNKRVLIRLDLNAPMDEQSTIMDDKRLKAALVSIEYALKQGAQVALMSHLGRPKGFDRCCSLKPIATWLQTALHHPVILVDDWLNELPWSSEHIVLCENVRFLEGETKNDDALARQMASLCDVFVMDAFATAHRAHASTHGVAKYAAIACAGLLLQQEMRALSLLKTASSPVVAVVGGAKISTKLPLLKSLAEKSQYLITGGGIANTLLAATGHDIGNSLFEPELLEQAKLLLENLGHDCYVPLPTDVVVTDDSHHVQTIELIDIKPHQRIMDIGPCSIAHYKQIINEACTIIWNGPLGVFEHSDFAQGTHAIAQAIADSEAYSAAGGGDTLSAIAKWQLEQKLSYISTGGGAFLAFLQEEPLPGIDVLNKRYKS